jgi:hypothetical protein
MVEGEEERAEEVRSALAVSVLVRTTACGPPPLSSVDWYAERPCEGCEKALQLAVEHAKGEHGVIKPLVACPDRGEGAFVVFEFHNPRIFEGT